MGQTLRFLTARDLQWGAMEEDLSKKLCTQVIPTKARGFLRALHTGPWKSLVPVQMGSLNLSQLNIYVWFRQAARN